MTDQDNQYLRIAAARADFLENGPDAAAGVPDVLAASWARSLAAGVDTDRPASDFTTHIDTGSRLIRCARPVLEQLENDTADLNLVIALTDHRARLLRRIDVSPAVGRLLDRVEFAPGFNYAETIMGTNGVGTVVEAGRAVSVVGPDHFTENLQPFACTGAPIVDPLTGRVEGILDITTVVQSWSPLMHTIVKSAAKDIARNLLMDRSQLQQALFESYLRTDARTTRQAVFAFAESVFMANEAAQSWFDPSEQLEIRRHTSLLLRGRDRVSDLIVLASHRAVRVRGIRILSGGDTAGSVVVAEVLSDRAAAALRTPVGGSNFHAEILAEGAVASDRTSLILDDVRRPYVPSGGGSAPAWIRACDELRSALLASQPTIVHGEVGSGKLTLVAELFHADHPGGRCIVIDATESHQEVGPEFDTLDGTTVPTLCIVRHIDRAGTEDVVRLDLLFRAIAEQHAPVSLAATLTNSDVESNPSSRALLNHFEVAVSVPALRDRAEDHPLIIGRLLGQIAPSRRVRLSPEAERTISRYPWPRNVSQLREALVHALRMRPVGEIQDSDLPAYCHTRTHSMLTPLQTAERDAIVAALQAHDGNRVAAANHVGMSRSSLYRKISAYGINA